MDDFMLRVQCPLDSCIDIEESMMLLGDTEQNMQCLSCGFASNNDMKTHIKPFPKDFKDICIETNKGRYWAPSVFTTKNYQVVPMVKDKELKWRIFAHQDPSTEAVVPNFTEAFKLVEKLEKDLGEKTRQQTDR